MDVEEENNDCAEADGNDQKSGFVPVARKGKAPAAEVPDCAKVGDAELTQQQINERANKERTSEIISAAKKRLEAEVKTELSALVSKPKAKNTAKADGQADAK